MKTQVQKVKERIEAWSKPIKSRLEKPVATAIEDDHDHDHVEPVSRQEAPPSGGRISSPFGMRVHPVHKEKRLHKGVDIAAGKRPAYAVADGQIVHAGPAGNAGNMVTIYFKDGEGRDHKYVYMHLDSLSVQKGQKIKKGDQIGIMGSTGDVTGVHLHLEHRIDNVAVPPTRGEINAAVPGVLKNK